MKEELKNVPKTKKADGSWWMSFTDFMMQFDRTFIGKVFPEAWETYSIEGEWHGKTNGGSKLLFYYRMSYQYPWG